MSVEATTTSGPVVGTEKHGVLNFRGIPYAASPASGRRFRPPEPPDPWREPRDCTHFSPVAPQNQTGMSAMIQGGQPAQSEAECLTLNVWTPGLEGRRPVMVWIHGGAFTGGSGSTPWYHGVSLAAAGDVVVVTLNYRLGALGFLHLAELLGDDYATSGNCGLLDQVAALEWVRDNIAAFGGDPQQVTVFGESAGGMSVGTLLATPRARGLFTAAAAQSGACHNVSDEETAATVARAVLEALGLERDEAKKLLDVPVDRLLRAQLDAGQAIVREQREATASLLQFQPVVDGEVLPRQPLAAVREGAAAGVRLLAGTTRDEWTLFALQNPTLADMDEDRLVRRAERLFGPAHGEGAGRHAVERYRASRPGAAPHEVWSAIETDRVFRIPATRLLEAQSAHQAETYAYWFTWESAAFGGRLRACHAVEIPFVFDNLDRGGVADFVGDPDQRARALATATSRSWLAFAHGETPGHTTLPAWEPYGTARRATMELGAEPALLHDPAGEERELWDGVL